MRMIISTYVQAQQLLPTHSQKCSTSTQNGEHKATTLLNRK